ncbi:MAG: type II and III secretion system protein, partial [Planctomycetota bacterium]|nr:type II and III secretion system protein [Planctomycetota bacterium]
GGGGGGNQQRGLGSLNSSALSGGGQQQIANRIGSQVGRAKIVEAAGGRILSTIQVTYLPLVRVDVRLYEVNSGKLRSWRNDLSVAQANFDQPGLLPSPEATSLQGPGAPTVNDGDLQGLLGFLNGTFSGRGQAVSGGFAVDTFFQLLVEEEIAKSMSNPSLAVLSGELAQFQVGGQIPIPSAVTVGGGTDQVLNSVEFRDYGIDLTVRPLVEERSSSRITLDVIPRISTPDLALTTAIGSATGQPSAATAFESRATRTSARVFDGEALVIGGLSLARAQSAQSRTPVLGSIPVLGWLFRNEADDDQESELVIVVTPSVIREPRPQADLWAFPSTEEILDRCRALVSAQDSEPDAEPAPEDRH